MIIEKIVVGPVLTNCYIVSDKEKGDAVVIDPGGGAEKISAYLRDKHFTLQAILLTHGHFDHIIAAEKLRSEFSAKVYCLEGEQELMADPVMNVGHTFGSPCALIPDKTFLDGEKLEFGAVSCRVIALPGHTSGGAGFYFEEEEILFSGDTLFFESVGRTDMPTGNERILLATIAEKIFTLPDSTKIYPGHGPYTSVGYEKENNPYL